MIEEFDLDMDGEISEQEFIKCVPYSPGELTKTRAPTDALAATRIMSDDV